MFRSTGSAREDEREDEEHEPGRGSQREGRGGAPRVGGAAGQGRRQGRARRTGGVAPGERLGEDGRGNGLFGEDVQQGEHGRYRRLRDYHRRAEPDGGRREGKQQRRARQVSGRDDELAARRGGVPSPAVEPAREEPAKAGGGDDRRGHAGNPVADGKGTDRDRH